MRAYVAGFEMGQLDAVLEVGRPDGHEQHIHAENAAQADLIAMRHGYSVTVTGEGEWRHLRLRQSAENMA